MVMQCSFKRLLISVLWIWQGKYSAAFEHKSLVGSLVWPWSSSRLGCIKKEEFSADRVLPLEGNLDQNLWENIILLLQPLQGTKLQVDITIICWLFSLNDNLTFLSFIINFHLNIFPQMRSLSSATGQFLLLVAVWDMPGLPFTFICNHWGSD